MEEHAKLAGLDGEAYDAQRKAWRAAAEVFHAVLTEYVANGDVGMSRHEVEQVVTRAVRHPEPES